MTSIKHVPQIDPMWPAVFKEPAFWDRRLIDEPAQRRFWTDDELFRAAVLLSRGSEVAVAAGRIGRTCLSLRARIAAVGGIDEFIRKYGYQTIPRTAGENPSSQPAVQQAAVLTPLPVDDASRQRGDCGQSHGDANG